MDTEQISDPQPSPMAAPTSPPREPGKPGRWKKGRERWGQLAKEGTPFERPKYLLVLGRNLRRWREQRKITQPRLAQAVGCSSRTIKFVESPEPRAIRHALIAQVALATGVPAPILMLDTDDLGVLFSQLLEVHGSEALILALSGAIMQRSACTSGPPAV